jgi:uncharacterized protein
VKTAVLKKDGRDLIGSVELATTLHDRMVGLLGRTSLGRDRAMYLSPCNSIHTFFMKFDLDLVFLSKSLRVVRVAQRVRPNRMAWGGRGSWSVVEMESGWFDLGALHTGDEIEICDLP